MGLYEYRTPPYICMNVFELPTKIKTMHTVLLESRIDKSSHVYCVKYITTYTKSLSHSMSNGGDSKA